MPVVVKFVRQLSHDLRNHLNAAELQSAFIGEIAEDAEIKAELKRLRAMLGEMAASLQKLSANLQDVKLSPLPYKAADFVEDLRSKVATQFADHVTAIRWQVDLDREAMLEIDPQHLEHVFLQLFDNAFRHDRGAEAIQVNARTDQRHLEVQLREPKTQSQVETTNWGRTPLRHLRHGHYGLGLYRARQILAEHRSDLDVQFDRASSSLVTTVRLPLAGGSAE